MWNKLLGVLGIRIRIRIMDRLIILSKGKEISWWLWVKRNKMKILITHLLITILQM